MRPETRQAPTAPYSPSRAEQIGTRAVGMTPKEHAANVQKMGTVKQTRTGGFILTDED